MKYIIALIAWTSIVHAQAQTIKGTVKDASTQPLTGASVYWLGTSTGTVTDADGNFTLGAPPHFPHSLVISFIGYLNDTVLLKEPGEVTVKLRPSRSLEEVVVSGSREAMSFSTTDPLNRQTLGTGELKKAACCNLSESFETNATVDVSYSDAVSGSRQIKMLGLDGSYTQVLHELMPGIRGLSTVSGYAHIPGTWVQGIDVTKGVGSVVSGYESISGQINIDMLKPEKTERLFVNLYAGDAGRYEGNIHLGHRFSKKWSSLLFMHGSGVFSRNDFNHDGYLDIPLSTQLNVLNKWKYEQPGRLMAMFGFQALVDDRKGGQLQFGSREDNDARRIYGVSVSSRHAEAFSKTAWGFRGSPNKSLTLVSNLRAYEQDAYYGFKTYKGEEQTLYLNLVYQDIIGSSDHKIKTGSSYMLDRYRENYRDSLFGRTESVPGIFTEYNYDIPERISVLLGLRADYHNLYGPMLNPRAHLKLHLRRLTVLRLSAGRGMRVANIFIEHAAAMASSRQVIVQERLNPEVAWNFGASLLHKFRLLQRNATFSLDYYRTDFQNQVVADLDASPQQVLFYNLKGRSYSNSIQAEMSYEPWKRFELRFAYKWQDVRTTYHGLLLQKPLIASDRVLLNLAYATRFDKWKFDLTAKWFGRNRIPSTASNPDGMRFGDYSSPYSVLNAQVTRKFKKFEIYLGAENIFDYVQSGQIIDPEHPFGPYFDASLVWGPIMGRVIYTGLRFTLK